MRSKSNARSSKSKVRRRTLSYALSAWSQASNARLVENGTPRPWMNPPDAGRVISKIARFAANQMCFVSSTTPRRRNSLSPRSWSDVVGAHALILIGAHIDRRRSVAVAVDDTRISRQVGIAVEDKRGNVVVSRVDDWRSRLETEVPCGDKEGVRWEASVLAGFAAAGPVESRATGTKSIVVAEGGSGLVNIAIYSARAFGSDHQVVV